MLASYADLLTALLRYGGVALMLMAMVMGVCIALYYRSEVHRLRYRPRAQGDLYLRGVVDAVWPVILGVGGLAAFLNSF